MGTCGTRVEYVRTSCLFERLHFGEILKATVSGRVETIPRYVSLDIPLSLYLGQVPASAPVLLKTDRLHECCPRLI
jgi:hypothetical protein